MSKNSFSNLQPKISVAGWAVPESSYACLSDHEKNFLELEFTGINSLNYYQARLQELGFSGCTSVLDAGCGMGQWSIAMSGLNNQVVGTDINIGRLFVAKDIANAMAIRNVEFQFSGAERSPFADQAFDAVFCYGVFMFTHMPSALAEFYRVLKPGGRLYLNVNSLGWYLHLLLDRGWKNRDLVMMKTALQMLLKTWFGKQQNVMVSPKRLQAMLERTGFQVLRTGPEGTITASGAHAAGQGKYPAEFYGQPAVTEVLASRPTTLLVG